ASSDIEQLGGGSMAINGPLITAIVGTPLSASKYIEYVPSTVGNPPDVGKKMVTSKRPRPEKPLAALGAWAVQATPPLTLIKVALRLFNRSDVLATEPVLLLKESYRENVKLDGNPSSLTLGPLTEIVAAATKPP